MERLDTVETLDLQKPNASWTVHPNRLNVKRSNFGATVLDKVDIFGLDELDLVLKC